MEYKYDVFISYRHSPLDRQVAEKLQKKLERYKIPKRLREKTGKRKIKRVFRDVEELSVGNDLAKEIEEQLKNSEFLIVICSSSSKESHWVDQEVRTFLKYHSSSKVLPLLIEGEPENAFPDALFESGEPFAADIRDEEDKNVLKKLNQEFLKILAPILYCSFDELKQRQKRYQMQKLVIFTGVAFILTLSFSVFMMIQNRRINKAYEGILENESRYLVSQAEQMEANGDHITAIRTLLDALPSKKQERPLVPEAQYRLTEYLHLYENENSVDDEFHAQGIMTVSGSLEEELLLDPTGKYILAHDLSQIYIWDTKRLELIQTIKTEYSIQNTIPKNNITENNHLFFSDDYTIYCYDYLNNKLIWRWNNPTHIKTVIYETEKNCLWALTENSIMILNPEDGAVLKRTVLNLEINEKINEDTDLVISPDGFKGVFVTSDENNNSFLNIYDCSLKKMKRIRCKGIILKTFLYDNETILYTCSGNETFLYCYDLGRNRILWNHRESEKSLDRIIDVNNRDEIHRNCIIYCYGNTMKILGVKDGEEKYCKSFGSDVRDILKGKNIILVICSSGKAGYCDFDSEESKEISFFPEELLCCVKQKDTNISYVMESGTRIVKYSIDEADENIKKEGIRQDTFVDHVIPYENGFINYDKTDGIVYYSDKKGEIQKVSLDLDSSSCIFSVYKTSSDAITFLCSDSEEKSMDNNLLKTINLDSQKVSSQKVSSNVSSVLRGIRDVDFVNGNLAYVDFQTKEGFCYITNIETGEEEQIVFSSGRRLSPTSGKIVLDPNVEKALVIDEEQLYLYLIDINSKEKIADIDLSDWTRKYINDIELSDTYREWIQWSESGKYYCISNDNNIFIYDYMGNLLHSIQYDSKNENGLTIRYAFSPDDRYLYYYYNRTLYQYDVKTGKKINSEELFEEKQNLDENVSWFFDNEHLAMLCENGFYFINTDIDHFGMLAYIPDGFFFDIKKKQFYIEYYDFNNGGNFTIGSVKQYDLDDILLFATKTVGEE